MSWFKILARSPKPEKRERVEKPQRKPKSKALSREDHALWSHVARSVTPLEGRVVPEIAATPPAAEHVPMADPPRALPPLARLDKRERRRLARGSGEIEARLDLHGLRQSEAHAALHGFLGRAHHAGAGLVLVITGKGGGQDPQGGERGVLRRLVPHWLADPAMRRIVLGFETAARGHGGEGALYVRLRRRRQA